MHWSRTSAQAAFAEKAGLPQPPRIPYPVSTIPSDTLLDHIHISHTMSEEDTTPSAPIAEVVAEKIEHVKDAGSAVEKKLEALEKKLEIPIKKAPGSALQLLSNVDKTVLRINKYGSTQRGISGCTKLTMMS